MPRKKKPKIINAFVKTVENMYWDGWLHAMRIELAPDKFAQFVHDMEEMVGKALQQTNLQEYK